ncbi:CPBP family intramembrane metalloprotease [Dactylosporangium roseum]|uniref:CPBP family intramembrane metalloprotease n=1 Tax=Dactylosporangium roseum TaxID=47989 RepID=A0ABY5YXQ1_9ACTN|nr:CPBP family intramembrane glutamic endopeptidase [Dactylosporangium roseum]UWZ33417.1 CPBP family intramembrane metalloprotease [Dactylosporangium roseum]
MNDRAFAGILSRRQELAELGVFLLLVVPPLVFSFVAAGRAAVSFPLLAGATIARDAGLVALILLLLSRARQPLAAIGWVGRAVGREVALGVALTAPVLVGAQALDAALRAAGLSGPGPSSAALLPPPGTGELILAVVLVAVVAVAEETIFRGYLILRFASVLRSRGWAVLLSSMIFSVGHGYEGGAGLLTVGATGLALAAVYLWRRSLVAPTVTHFLLDLVAIVVPLLLR